MSSSTRPPDVAVAGQRAVSLGRAALARLLLAIAYPLLAHTASHLRDGRVAALALADIVLIVLLWPLLQRRGWAWALLATLLAGLWLLAGSGYALLPLLLVPVAFVAFVSYGFGRTLVRGRTALITRIVAALDGIAPTDLAADLRRYTRGLTACWAGLLGVLAVLNLALALLAVPDGLLAGVGITPPLAIAQAQWSWFANFLNYGIVGAFLLLEFAIRQRRFPGRYHSFLDFLRRLAALGPGFWRDLSRHP